MILLRSIFPFRVVVLLALVLSSLLVHPLTAATTSADWPAMGNDNGHTGFLPVKLAPVGAPTLVWTRSVPLLSGGTAWPAVVGGGTIFTTITSDTATLLAVDVQTGALRYRVDLMFRNYKGDLEPASSYVSTPVFAAGRVYFCVEEYLKYQMVCMDAATGNVLWYSPEVTPYSTGFPSPPLVTTDGIYLNVGYDGGVATMYRFSTATGELLAQATSGNEALCGMAMAGGRLVGWYDATETNHPTHSGYGIATLDPVTLEVLGFTRLADFRYPLDSTPVVGDGLAFVGDLETNSICAIDLVRQERLWSQPLSPDSPMSYANGVLYVNDGRNIAAFDARTGARRMTYRPDAAGVEAAWEPAVVTSDSLIANGSKTFIWTLGNDLPRTVLPHSGATVMLAGADLVMQSAVHPSAPAATPMTVYRFPTNTNRPPLASNQTVRGVSDADVRVVLKVSDPDQDPLSVRVITAPTRGRLSTAAPTMTYVPAPGFIGTDRFTYRVSDGSSESATATVTIVIDPRGAFIERDGQVVVEAEHPHRRIAGRGAASASVWTRVTDVAGYSGSAALRALANAGVNTGTAPDGPRLDYDIQFTTPGTYHLWLRLQGASDADDSVLVGLDGAVARLDPTGLRAPGNTWQWSNAGADRRRYTVCVTTPGVHTFNVWMREDGVAFDKVLLTTSATTVPAGIGSAESRFLPASNHPPVAVIHSDVVAGRAPLRVAFSSAGARDPEGGAITVRWLFGGGAGASGPSATRTFTTPGIYRPTVIVTDAVGAIGVATTTVVVLPPAGPIVESDGIIVIEAEDLDRQTSGSGSAADAFWLPTRSLAGFTGHGAAQALPNTGINTGTAITGPRLDYQLQVDRPGTYYLWIRMQGATGNDDSVHLGLNGQLVTAGGQGVTPATFGSWQWSNRIAGAGVVRVTIPAAGRHVLNLWMREDGVAVDRLMLTTDPAFRPACTGPAANPRLPQGSG